MDKEVMIAAIGVGGTLLGTVLGWFLNNLSSKGKLYIYVCSWQDKFEKKERIGGFTNSHAAESIDEVESYSYSLSLDLYNSSGATKIMRNIQIGYTDGWKVLWSEMPDDQATQRFTAGAIWYDKIDPINVPPKAVIKLNLRDGIWNSDGELDFLWNSKKVYLQYTDEKNKRRRKLIKKEDYANYFSNHTTKEKK